MSNCRYGKLMRHFLLFLLVMTICITSVACALKDNSGTISATEPTEVMEEEDVVLYFNVDRDEYAGKGADGLTGRTKDPDTGYYHISFASNGRVSARRVLNMSLATKIDNQDVMALVLNEDGIVSDIITVDECAGGYFMGGKRLYVSAVDGNVLTVYGNSGMYGSSYTLEYTADTKIYDVSSDAKENGTQGSITDITVNDKILAVLNKDGSVGWIYVMDRVTPMETKTMYCDHCHEEVVWYGWNKEDSLPISGEGHYYLTSDVACNGQMTMEQNANIVLDLNGHTVTSKEGKRVYSLHNTGAYLAIMDYSEEQSGKLVASATTEMANEGACVWVRYGTFELYGGTLDASGVTGHTNGVTVHVRKDATFIMHGGAIIGGTSLVHYDSESKSYKNGLGGAIYVGGTFEMRGGTITGGNAQGIVSGNTTKMGYGGNIYISDAGVVNMTGGVIKNGVATARGGNIAGSGVVNMTGGVIKDGVAVSGGGNVSVTTFTMSGSANISGGRTTGKGKNGGSVYITSDSIFNMYGGGIYGGTSKLRWLYGAVWNAEHVWWCDHRRQNFGL